MLTWSGDPNNLLKSYVDIGNIDLHKCGDFGSTEIMASCGPFYV